MANTSNSKDKESALNKLRNATFSPKPIYCCPHIPSALETERNPNPRFVATQIYDNSYNIFWCCENCAHEHKIPYPGVFIALEDYCSSDIDKLIVFSRKNDNDENPYAELVQASDIDKVQREEFEKYARIPSTEEVMNTRYRIPFGIKVEKIL